MANVFEEIGSPSIDADALGERMEAGGMVPEGLYPVRLEGAKNITSKQKETPGYELTFVILSGAFKGSQVTDTLWRTDNPRSRDRIALFGHRLGLLKRDENGKLVPIPGKGEFIDVLDVEVLIEVEHEEYEREDKSKGHKARLAFGGIYTADDAKALEKLKAQVPGAAGAAGAAKAKTGDTAKKAEPKSAAAGKSNGTDDAKPAAKKRDLSDL